MTFVAEAQIEARAAELWRAHGLEPGFDVERLLDLLDLRLLWEDVDDEVGGIGDGEGHVYGLLVPTEQLVILNERHRDALEEKGGRLRRFTVGHEIGHWIIHAKGIGLSSCSLFDGRRIHCRSKSTDSIERQAEMFSAALLMHRDILREALPSGEWSGWPTVYRLAEKFGVNVTPMAIRLERLEWMHRDRDDTPVSGPRPPERQESLFG
jgi:hypothetical protein